MSNQDLINYINQARVEGISDPRIKESLLKAGWNQTDIDDAFVSRPDATMAPITHSSSPEILKKTPIAKIAIIAILAILLISGTTGAFYYADKQFNWGILVPKKIVENTKSDEIANWQVYKNDDYGYQIKYPTGWRTEFFCSNKSGTFPPSRCVGFFPPNKEKGTLIIQGQSVSFEYYGEFSIIFMPKMTIEKWLSFDDDLKTVEKNERTINGKISLILYGTGSQYSGAAKFLKPNEVMTERIPSGGKDFTEKFSGSNEAWITMDEKGGILLIASPSSSKDIFEKMLSTLQFIK